jgi:aryl sulfotransferase
MLHTQRSRDYSGPVTNTDIWSSFALRADDVIVCTPPKCGTTWTLGIVMMLIHGRAVPGAGNREESPWLDCAFRDRTAIAAFLNGLERRRCIKSHTPMDGIAYAAEPTYIVVYRHPIDAHFSLRAHANNMKVDFLDFMFPPDERAGFRRFLENPLTDTGTDDLTLDSLVHHYKTARALRDRGNVFFFHYADLSRDLPGQIRRMAGILDIDLPPKILTEITEANTFAQARKVAEASAERFGDKSPYHDQADFYASGTSNKWQGRLTDADLATYDDRIKTLLPPEDVKWLNWGDQKRAAE